MPAISVSAIVLLAFFALRGSCTLQEFQANLEIDHLSDAATQIIQQFYSERTSAISLIRLAMQPFAYYKQSEIINRVLLRTKSTIAYVIEEPKQMKYSPFLRSSAILFFDGFNAFRYEIKFFSRHQIILSFEFPFR